MKTRMEKYYDNTKSVGSRTTKNSEIYKETNKATIEDFNVNSNVKVLGTNSGNIDIDKIKEILDKKYREPQKRKSVDFSFEEENTPISIEETREYDITTVLERAKEQKEANYEHDRLKKIRDTQYDILKNLNLETKEEKEVTPAEEELLELIHTITEKEMLKQEMTPLDLFEDLKGSENTMVLDGLRDDIESLTKPIKIIPNSPKEEKPIEMLETVVSTTEEKVENKNTISIDKSFFTNSMSFSQSDFDDFNDLKEEIKSSKIIINILIVVVVIAVLIGLFLLLNNILDWGII